MDDKLTALKAQMNKYFAGKEDIVNSLLCCFVAGGHLLLEDVPGVGKTTLARTFAASLGVTFGRIQFTPDTMPSDVTGLSVYNMKSGDFSYREGSIMRNIILADELNRTSPKTQAALLEAMAESQVTVDGKAMKLPDPFMVIATQNPISFTGTYPLPEASLDRFMMRLSIGYPSAEEEIRMVKLHIDGKILDKATAVLDEGDIARIKEAAASVHISDSILSYMQRIIDNTRHDPGLMLGASPRALIHLMSASRAAAYLADRDYVTPDDVKSVACAVLAHRLVVTTEMRLQKKDAASILEALIIKTSVPMD